MRFLEQLEPRALLAGTAPNIGADMVALGVSNPTGYTDAQLTVASALPIQNGYNRTVSATTDLGGTADAAVTGSVFVSGQEATWSPGTGTWTATSVALKPGINRVFVESFTGAAGTGTRIDQDFIDIWRDNSGASGASFSFPRGSVWSYKDDGSNQGTAWRATDPNPAWATGAGQLGYGDGDETTVVSSIDTDPVTAGVQHNITTYFRRKFTIPAGQAALFNQISVEFLRDDGGAVYINGVEVVRTTNLPGTLGDNAVLYTTTADFNGAITTENALNTFNVPAALVPGLLHDGENVIAAEIHQHDSGSSDISFDLGLTAIETSAGGGTNVSGALPAGTTTWTADAGPYRVTADLSVPAGAMLVVQPGTSVFVSDNAAINVAGRLDAQGTPYSMIRVTRNPSSIGVWSGIQFNNTMQDNHIAYAVLEWASPTSNNGLVGISASKLTLENSTLDHAERRRIRTQNAWLVVRNNIFTEIFAPGVAPSTDNLSEHIWGANVAAGGEWIVQNNVFGLAKGHNDVIDVDSGTRGVDPVPQILNNTFLGGGDDAMDLQGDFHIEANLILNFVRDQWNTATGNSNGISAGGTNKDYYVARNIFKNVQDITTVKQNAFMRMFNNTIIGALAGGISFAPPDDPVPGRGGIFDGNIFSSSPSPFSGVTGATQMTVTRNVITADQAGMGVGNISSNPLLVNPALPDAHLQPGSPAIGTGPNGLDMGAEVPGGASISGEPPAQTTETTATLTVGGPTVLSYKYRVNGGAWSAETAVATPISLTGLVSGTYMVEAVGRNDAGVWQPDAAATHSDSWTVLSTVNGRHVFYNDSSWDGNDATANAGDDAAIATDKTALLPGGTGALVNYTSFSKGLNGIMVDLANLGGTPTINDFAFTTGNANDTNTWTPLATPPGILVRPGAGVGGSTRVTLTWPNNTIAKKWLRVSVLANSNTGLSADDVFYYGNAVGEAGNSAVDAQVNAADELAARGNPRNIANPAPITFLYDYNRDKQVNAADQLISRGNPTNLASRLILITPAPGAGVPGGAGLAEAALGGDEWLDQLARRTRRL